MKIIILGAGRVGATLAQHLAHEENDITLIDTNAESLQVIQDRCDVRTIVGHGAHPDILVLAGIEDTDMLIAVTNSDESNMVACQIAYSLFNTPTKIARIRSGAYTRYEGLFTNESVPVDVVISPEQLVTQFVTKLIDYPGTLQVLDFVHCHVMLVVIKVESGSDMANHEIKYLKDLKPELDMRITAIYRKGRSIIVDGNTMIVANDEVFFISAKSRIKEIISLFRVGDKPYKRVIIAGGGHIGSNIAHLIENDFTVKIIEHNHNTVQSLAARLNETVILEGDASDRELLLDENIQETDIFCAVTNNDEANIMSSLLAKRLGVRKVMTLVNNSSYVDLIEGGEIDVVISPQQATLSGLLSHVRKADIVQVHTLRRGAAEAIEIIAHGSSENSKVIDKRIDEIQWPKNVTVGAVVRKKKVIIAHNNTVIKSEDHVILFIPDKPKIRAIEKLFQVGITYF